MAIIGVTAPSLLRVTDASPISIVTTASMGSFVCERLLRWASNAGPGAWHCGIYLPGSSYDPVWVAVVSSIAPTDGLNFMTLRAIHVASSSATVCQPASVSQNIHWPVDAKSP